MTDRGTSRYGVAAQVAAARAGRNPAVIARAASGWFVLADVQLLPGRCLLLPDPVVASINHLSQPERRAFLLDMVGLGDALLQATGAQRINYEILGNSEPQLHAHVTPRYAWEPGAYRRRPVWRYEDAGASPAPPTDLDGIRARTLHHLHAMGLVAQPRGGG